MNYSRRLHEVIPGGAHTYSRGDDQFPSNAPSILSHGNGCRVWDPSGREYIDYGMGLRSVNLGYGNVEVAEAVYNEAIKGNNLTRPSLTELNAAELLSEMIESANMVKFAKHGSTVTTAAMKLARAYTGRKYIAIPFEQPFFSFDDWFIGTTVMNKGIPEEMSNLTLRFNYNNISSLQDLFDKYPGQIAGVMLEAATTIAPCFDECKKDNSHFCRDCPDNERNYLHKVQELCYKNGTVFILDEMITGFRWHLQGAQYYYGISPDLATFGKAMANGFAVAALTGKSEIMKIGGILDNGEERVFLTSTTHGAEMSALGAFIKTMEILKREEVVSHFWKYGQELINGINSISNELGILENFYLEGYPCSPSYIAKDIDKNISLSFRTLFAQEMINNGIMMPYIALSMAHTNLELEITLEAVKKSLIIYSQALNSGIDKFLKSSIIKPVFRRYN